MTTIEPRPAPATTLGDLVTARPGAARVLERLGLDYCCGGRRSLAAACAEQGIDAAVVLAELADAPAEPVADWASMGPVDLVDHIEATHHRYLHAELRRLGALAAKVRSVHGRRHPELGDVVATFEDLRADLEPHLLKEERVLFPMIRALASAGPVPAPGCGSVRNPISVMVAEHDRAGELLARLRRLTGDFAPPADGCVSYRTLYAALAELEADTHLHVHKENNVLFPAVVELESRPPAPSA